MRFWILLSMLVILTGCVTTPVERSLPGPMQTQGEETVWRGEYAFKAPPPPWQIYDMNEEDVTLVFTRRGGEFAGQTAISYAEEPFGYSRELRPRANEFLNRYLWAARIRFETPTFRESQWNGKPALEMTVLGREPVKRQKARGKILFGYRGERIVAFIMTQWQDEGKELVPEDKEFQAFIDSFRFVKPSYYQELGIGK